MPRRAAHRAGRGPSVPHPAGRPRRRRPRPDAVLHGVPRLERGDPAGGADQPLSGAAAGAAADEPAGGPARPGLRPGHLRRRLDQRGEQACQAAGAGDLRQLLDHRLLVQPAQPGRPARPPRRGGGPRRGVRVQPGLLRQPLHRRRVVAARPGAGDVRHQPDRLRVDPRARSAVRDPRGGAVLVGPRVQRAVGEPARVRRDAHSPRAVAGCRPARAGEQLGGHLLRLRPPAGDGDGAPGGVALQALDGVAQHPGAARQLVHGPGGQGHVLGGGP